MSDPDFNEFLLKSIMEQKDIIPGGLADNAPDSEFDEDQLEIGTKAEMEHTSDKTMAKEIAKDHLKEDPKYYTKLERMESESISRKKPISEKQTAKQRHAKHKEWRKKNPQKVRDQVARHQTKTDQNKNREDTRQRKNRGEISKDPKCAVCGSKANVEHDHDKGYKKGAPTTPRCHKHHTEQPQQNSEGDRSVQGGTEKVAKEDMQDNTDYLMKIIADDIDGLDEPEKVVKEDKEDPIDCLMQIIVDDIDRLF